MAVGDEVGIDVGMTALQNAVNDATEMAKTLEEKHGFEVYALYNEQATKKNFFDSIIENFF